MLIDKLKHVLRYGAILATATFFMSGCNLVTDDASTLTPTAWSNLKPKITIDSVSFASGTPVVNFTVIDDLGNPIVNLDKITAQSSTAKYAGRPNFTFNVAKLIPPTSSSPSRWVNLMVISPDTNTAAMTPAALPTTDPASIGKLISTGQGTYQYTFWTDITKVNTLVQTLIPTSSTYNFAWLGAGSCPGSDLCYDATKVHRVTVSVFGNAPGTGTNTPTGVQTAPGVWMVKPANAFYDFIPSSGALAKATDPSQSREIVSSQNCFQCHTNFSKIHNGSYGVVDTKLCVTCHTDQLKWMTTEATTSGTNFTSATDQVDGFSVYAFPNLIHKVHTGEGLTMQGYNAAGNKLNEITYPQDQRNCTKCHTGQSDGYATATPQGDNWKNAPNRLACGGCHDGINFATGGGMNMSGTYAGHKGGAKTDDSMCSFCHSASSVATLVHVATKAPDANSIYANPTSGNNNTNASYVATVRNNLPAGAIQIAYDLKSVTLNASAQPVFTFRLLADGSPVVFNSYSPSGKTEMMDNFVGSPSAYLAFAVPQDGITHPADWNATVNTYVKNVWRGTGLNDDGSNMSATGAGMLTGPDSTGYYTLTLTGVKIPITATMMTGGIGYSYGLLTTQPITQTNVTSYPYDATTKIGGVSVPPSNAWKLVSGTLPTGFGTQTGRRLIVENARCDNCHQALGIFTKAQFHAGQRNDSQTCTFCHNANRTNTSGWGVNLKDAVHSLHAGDMRANKFSWQAASGDAMWKITYPSPLQNCEACHLPGTYDFSTTASAVPNLLWTTAAIGAIPASINVVVTGNEPIPGIYFSPFVVAGVDYGKGFATNFATGSTAPYVDAAGTTLVNSPITSACSGCHDSATSISHYTTNGGAFYAARTTVTPTNKTEQCLVCHGTGQVSDIKAVHLNIGY